MNPTLSSIVALLPIFFHHNPTVDAAEIVLPQVLTAITNARAGSAFTVSFPEAVGGHAGTSTFSWSPT